MSSKVLFWAPIIVSTVYNVPKFFELTTCEAPWLSIIEQHLNTTNLNFTPSKKNAYSNHEAIHDNSFELLHLNLTEKIKAIEGVGSADNETTIVSQCDIDGMRATPMRQNKLYIIFYVVISKVVLVEILPWLTVITLNILTWKKMNLFQERRRAMLNRRHAGNRLDISSLHYGYHKTCKYMHHINIKLLNFIISRK